jgi:hypothetical protein
LYVTGNINNNTDQFLYMNMSALGYNSDMKVVSIPIGGTSKSGNSYHYYLSQHTEDKFELMLTWGEDVKLIEIVAASDNTDDYIFMEP